MITNGRAHAKEPNVATSFSELAHDVIELTELQAQLMVLDVKNATQKTRTSVILGVTAFCMLLGSIPVARIRACAIVCVVVRLAAMGRVRIVGDRGSCDQRLYRRRRLVSIQIGPRHDGAVSRGAEPQYCVDQVELAQSVDRHSRDPTKT